MQPLQLRVNILTEQFILMQRTNHMQRCFGSIVHALHGAKTTLSIYLSLSPLLLRFQFDTSGNKHSI